MALRRGNWDSALQLTPAPPLGASSLLAMPSLGSTEGSWCLRSPCAHRDRGRDPQPAEQRGGSTKVMLESGEKLNLGVLGQFPNWSSQDLCTAQRELLLCCGSSAWGATATLMLGSWSLQTQPEPTLGQPGAATVQLYPLQPGAPRNAHPETARDTSEQACSCSC